MDILKDPYFILARVVTSILGFWPTQTFNQRVVQTCIVSFSLLYAILAQLCQLFTLDFDLQSIVWVLQMLLPFLCITSAYYTLLLHTVTVRSLFTIFMQDWQQLKDEVELKIMRRHVYENKLFTTAAALLSFVLVNSSALPFLIRVFIYKNDTYGEERYPAFSCFDYFLGLDHYYYPIIIYQAFTAALMGTVTTICYSQYFWLIQHACARLCIIKGKIHELFENDQHKGNVFEKPQDLSDWTIDIIQRLARTKKFMGLVNELGEKSCLFQTLMAFILLIVDFLCMFEVPILMQNRETRRDAYGFLIFIVDTVVIIYLNCYIGQRLVDYSNDVYKEMCLIPIHDISVKTQKLLLMTLMMNSKPCAISIGKMFMASHAFFSDLLQTALSFAMVLHSMRQI